MGREDMSGNANEAQKFSWLCGLCDDRPTFSTVYDLFAHKKTHRQAAKIAELNTNECDYLRDGSQSNSSLAIVESNIVSIPSDDDDVPLSQWQAKSVKEETVDPSVVTKIDVCASPIEDDSLYKLEVDESQQDTVISQLIEIDGDQHIADTEPFQDDCDDKNDVWDEACSDQSALDDSMKKDTKTNRKCLQHICKICKEEFPSRRSLSQHKLCHLSSETGLFKCSVCGKECSKYDNFSRHMQIHEENRLKSHTCSICSASFYSIADLKRHSILHMDVKPYICDHCGEGFRRQYSLLVHMEKHTGVPYKKFACELCHKILNSPSSLAMHRKNHTEKSIFCKEDKCNFSCYLKSQLKQHMRIHNGDRPFQCSICGRCFSRGNDMKNHILNVHEKVRPHKCSECAKEFTLLSTLKSHMSCHLDFRPYLCSECGKGFNHPSTLRKHVKYIHRHFCEPCCEKKQHKDTHEPAELKIEEIGANAITYSLADVDVQSQLPLVAIPVHIPQISVNMDQGYTQAYLIPTITIPANTNTHIMKEGETDRHCTAL